MLIIKEIEFLKRPKAALACALSFYKNDSEVLSSNLAQFLGSIRDKRCTLEDECEFLIVLVYKEIW